MGNWTKVTGPVNDNIVVTPVAGVDQLYTNSFTATTSVNPIGSQSCLVVHLQADPDNTLPVLVGNSSTQVYKLYPGDPVTISVRDVGMIYARTASGTAKLNWIAY
jgi:hypothetical protein